MPEIGEGGKGRGGLAGALDALANRLGEICRPRLAGCLRGTVDGIEETGVHRLFKPVYQQVTMRNWATTRKIAEILERGGA